MDMNSLKQRLLEQQMVFSSRIETIRKDFAAGRSADFSEQATEMENDEVLVQLKGEAEQELREVNHALEKMASGEYGICEQCAGEIQAARLATLPFTRCCIHCAQ